MNLESDALFERRFLLFQCYNREIFCVLQHRTNCATLQGSDNILIEEIRQ